MFDHATEHFSTVVPLKALSNDLLLGACLSAASKQYYLTASVEAGESIALYDSAIQKLYTCLSDPVLRGKAETFAACLLIAFTEMIDNNTHDWQIHLRGTREIIALAHWHGASEGLGGEVCFSILTCWLLS